MLCLTFSGLSKAYRVCGFRAGWVMISGPKELATDFLEGLTLIANMRMCANVPAQHAIQTALGGYQSIEELIVPGRALLRADDARRPDAQRDPRRHVGPRHVARSTASPGWTPTSTPSTTTSRS